jgi:hypothetical protein
MGDDGTAREGRCEWESDHHRHHRRGEEARGGAHATEVGAKGNTCASKLQAVCKKVEYGCAKSPSMLDDEAGRRGLMCSTGKSPTSSLHSNCVLPPYHCRQLTAYLLRPLVGLANSKAWVSNGLMSNLVALPLVR